MHVISYKKIREFSQIHSRAISPLNNWYKIVKNVDFDNFSKIRELFPSADQVGNFVVFNIGGNKYRLIAAIHFNRKKVFIRHILSHQQYDRNKWKRG